MNRREVLGILPGIAVGAALTKPSAAAETAGEKLSLRYLSEVRSILEEIRSTELDNLLEASYHIAKTRKNGGVCYTTWDVGHTTIEDMYPDRPGDTDIFTAGYPEEKAKKGDLLLGGIIAQKIKDPREKGVFLIGSAVPWCGDTPDARLLSEQHRQYKIRPYSDIWVETYSTTWGPIIWLPGAKYPMGAVSGAIGMTTFWMMTADAVRILASEGVAVKVKGDEPKLGEKTHYASLNAPLGEDYLAEVLNQLRQIEGELGTAEKVADIAVDAVLGKHSVYVYSDYWEGLAIESNTRMGGLSIYKSVFRAGPESGLVKNFKGTSGDLVIMGICTPDNPNDLAFLDLAKKNGCTVASIGPATRDKAFPAGRCVPSEADYHLGFMCDTYGLFAFPGLERKVCPTSGVVQNQLFYAVSMSIAQKIIERTGNNPTIYPNGAFDGSPYTEFGRVHTIGLKRGY
jgi:hypothetical protein